MLRTSIETLSTQKKLISAAAIPNSHSDGDHSPYQGWYLATCQGNDCELLFIYTSKIHRSLGLGKALLRDLIARAGQASEMTSIFLEVRKSNQNGREDCRDSGKAGNRFNGSTPETAIEWRTRLCVRRVNGASRMLPGTGCGPEPVRQRQEVRI